MMSFLTNSLSQTFQQRGYQYDTLAHMWEMVSNHFGIDTGKTQYDQFDTNTFGTCFDIIHFDQTYLPCNDYPLLIISMNST